MVSKALRPLPYISIISSDPAAADINWKFIINTLKVTLFKSTKPLFFEYIHQKEREENRHWDAKTNYKCRIFPLHSSYKTEAPLINQGWGKKALNRKALCLLLGSQHY